MSDHIALVVAARQEAAAMERLAAAADRIAAALERLTSQPAPLPAGDSAVTLAMARAGASALCREALNVAESLYVYGAYNAADLELVVTAVFHAMRQASETPTDSDGTAALRAALAHIAGDDFPPGTNIAEALRQRAAAALNDHPHPVSRGT